MNFLLKMGSTGKEVEFLQTWLNVLVSPSPGLTVSGTFDDKTKEAAKKFQGKNKLQADGAIGALTWWALMDQSRWGTWTATDPPGTPQWLQNFHLGPSERALSFNRATFGDLYGAIFGGAVPKGLDALLGYLERDTEVKDVRWAAYMLATVKHECANTWQPIEEYGKGKGHTYGEPVKGPDGKMHTYYGRGYVQLTWKTNYEKMSKALELTGDDDLVTHPERALDAGIAYKIMSYGMRHGSFTGKKLGDYIQARTCDYFHARRIINALDRAALIVGYAKKLELGLVGSL